MNYLDPSSLTIEEAYRINGTLPPDKIEELLGCMDIVDGLGDVHELLQNANQYPADGFLRAVIQKLEMENPDLERISRELDHIQDEVARDAARGREALSAIGDLMP